MAVRINSIRLQRDRLAGFHLGRGEFGAEEGTEIGVAHEPDKPDYQEDNQKLEQFAHGYCPLVLSFF
ncbi:hypothetical protein ACFSUD_07420 [Sulfitobacter aestuarii]|uniref:Uncharacterized protein n=1 Tax=Sulfitobacter aestuarii TaxID=2161676 RepID=A0ABW5U0T9_9RHOB